MFKQLLRDLSSLHLRLGPKARLCTVCREQPVERLVETFKPDPGLAAVAGVGTGASTAVSLLLSRLAGFGASVTHI